MLLLLPAAEVKPMSRHVAAVSYQVPVYDQNGKTFHQRQPYRLRTMRTVRAAADSGEQQAPAELPASTYVQVTHNWKYHWHAKTHRFQKSSVYSCMSVTAV